MSKELKALKHIISGISNYTLHGIGDENWLGFQDVLSDVKLIEQALTPPTEQEVCEALGEYLRETKPYLFMKKVSYDSGGFHYYNNEDYEIYLAEYDEIEDTMYFPLGLPPHLVEMIGKFYKGKVKE